MDRCCTRGYNTSMRSINIDHIRKMFDVEERSHPEELYKFLRRIGEGPLTNTGLSYTETQMYWARWMAEAVKAGLTKHWDSDIRPVIEARVKVTLQTAYAGD